MSLIRARVPWCCKPGFQQAFCFACEMQLGISLYYLTVSVSVISLSQGFGLQSSVDFGPEEYRAHGSVAGIRNLQVPFHLIFVDSSALRQVSWGKA